MIKSAKVRKRRIEKLIEGPVGLGSLLKPFRELPDRLQSSILARAKLLEDEEILIPLVQAEGSWLLITTERLIWCSVDGVHRLHWNQIKGVQPPKEDLESIIRGNKEKTDLRVLHLFDGEGAMYEIELGPGASYLLAWNAILALCDYSRPLDLPEIKGGVP